MKKGGFATAINCIDGRVQIPVAEWIKEQFNVDYVDAITEPGPDKVLTQGQTEKIESIKQKALISVNAHHSEAIAIAAHHDCAGNPVSKEEHLRQIKRCVEIVKSWGLPVQVVGLWVNEQWKIEVV